MRLKHLKIANCSRIADIDIDVRSNLVLIGPNGAGKTTVLLCLDMLLGMSDERLRKVVSAGLVRDKKRRMTVEAEFCSLSADEREAFATASNGTGRADATLLGSTDRADATLLGSTGEHGLAVRLEVGVNKDGTVTIERSFPGQGPYGLSDAQRAAFGWAVLQARAGKLGIRDASAPGTGAASTQPGRAAEESNCDAPTANALANGILDPDNAAASEIAQLVGRAQPAIEQSDGVRALLDLATYELLHEGANVLAIDEPEAHLHPSSQRSLAKMLKAGSCQKILVTHSPTIAGSFEPDEIVVIRPDGSAVQPQEGFLEGDAGMLARWWIGKQLEPLTAGSVIAVEGPSDRIIVSKVASAFGFDLDRHDVVIVETNGCGDMKVIESIFGGGGFDIPLYELIDEDAADEASRRIGVDEARLAARGVFVSTRDLEDEYVQAIGAHRLWDRFRAAHTFSTRTLALCQTGRDGYPTETALAQFIREKSKRKIPAALVAASLIDASNAHSVRSVASLLEDVTRGRGFCHIS